LKTVRPYFLCAAALAAFGVLLLFIPSRPVADPLADKSHAVWQAALHRLDKLMVEQDAAAADSARWKELDAEIAATLRQAHKDVEAVYVRHGWPFPEK
jgi:hypothetical protein